MGTGRLIAQSVLMHNHSCPYCVALFTEMRSAVDEAKTIAQKAGALIHASRPSEHIDGWMQSRERWQNARRRWLEAARDLQNHLSRHPCTPTSAKNMPHVQARNNPISTSTLNCDK